jgi:bifunctional UDP-N-acetylglucosamine pyrophosphorylase/glucosamine-1-phosphate N-acetyltransferase
MVSKKPTAVIILAAGKGTRMKSDLPKVLHKVAGKTMLEHVIDSTKSLSPEKTVIVVAPNSKEVEKAAGKAEIAIQKTQLGTGDAVKAAKDSFKNFDGNVVILAGDSPLITPETLQNLIANLQDNQIHMLGFIPDDAAKYGRLVTKGNEVLEIVEFKDASEKQKSINICNSGIYALNAKLLFQLLDEVHNKNAQKEYYLTDIVKIAKSKKIKTFYHTASAAEVLGVNDKSELAAAEKIIQNRLRQQALVNGVTMTSPETIFLQADTKFGKNVTLLPFVVIGEDVEIGDNVQIGPFAHIRPHTKLMNGAKIGNFVEIKKSVVGENSKVNHLSYIGDSVLGDNVNIGAGTITCNYDGFDKFQTIIEDGAFIGSDSALIAPVKVGTGAIVAAGSTITKDVPANSLAVARETQKNLADWAVKFRKRKTKK